jgi:murein DD-endopeptidase MepM/ murein hydrolase activator NlpD
MAETTFNRVLKLGSTGRDVLAVKRALSRAGFIRWRKQFTPVLGPYAVKGLKEFQRKNGILSTGKYGPRTHRALLPHFDARARKLYEESSKQGADVVAPKPPASGHLQLPKRFRATHQTGGLPGYPAIDVFARPGTVVLAPASGTIVKLSGRSPAAGGSPGGSYGYSMYLRSEDPKGVYFLTHFGSRIVSFGSRVKEGQPLGTVCDSAVSGKPGTSHIHEGFNAD